MSNDPYPNPNAPYAPAATTPGIPVQQPSQPFASEAGPRKKGLVIAGLLVLLAGVGGGFAALLMSGSAVDEAVESLARAPVGCTTTLEFDSTGTFTVFVETTGTANVGRGDCPGNGDDYERDADDLPDVDLVLVAEGSDDEIDLRDDDGKSYDAGGSAGRSIGTFEIDDAGEYELTVTSDDGDDDFAIAIGKDPEAAADTLKLLSYLLIGLGVVLGALLIGIGLRRRSRPPTGGSPPVTYQPDQQPRSGYQPTGAHTAPSTPPSTSPSTPPSFGGSFSPPSVNRPSDPFPPTQQTPSGPQWPAPPSS